MPQTPSDATRFTATGPYVSAKPSPFTSPASTGSTMSFAGSSPEGEKPQQKIARLRAAAAKARMVHESRFDKTVRIGRVWADRAHRVTALSLIGFTIVTAIVATYTLADMTIHNRRKRNEWIEDRIEKARISLERARQAEREGTVTEDQMLLINLARASEEEMEAKKNKKGMFVVAKEWMFSRLSAEERRGGKIGAMAQEARERANIGRSGEDGLGIVKAVVEKVQAAEQTADNHRRSGEKVEEVLRPFGGPLDREAQVVAEAAVTRGKSWTNWATGR